MPSTHLLISQKDIETLFQSLKSQNAKEAIMSLWEAGNDLDLSTTATSINIATTAPAEASDLCRRYWTNGYKKAIEHISSPQKTKA